MLAKLSKKTILAPSSIVIAVRRDEHAWLHVRMAGGSTHDFAQEEANDLWQLLAGMAAGTPPMLAQITARIILNPAAVTCCQHTAAGLACWFACGDSMVFQGEEADAVWAAMERACSLGTEGASEPQIVDPAAGKKIIRPRGKGANN